MIEVGVKKFFKFFLLESILPRNNAHKHALLLRNNRLYLFKKLTVAAVCAPFENPVSVNLSCRAMIISLSIPLVRYRIVSRLVSRH